MLPSIHLKDEVEPGQIPLTLINLSHDVIQVTKHILIGSLWLYADYQKMQI